jgi:hypothetical protein
MKAERVEETRMILKLRMIWNIIRGRSVMYRMEIIKNEQNVVKAIPLDKKAFIVECVFYGLT